MRLKFRQPGTKVSVLNHYTLAAFKFSPATKDKSSSRAGTDQVMEKLKGKISMPLSSHGEMPRAKEGEAKGSAKSQAGARTPGQTSAVPPAAYYQPSLTAEYDEDSPGGDFDFFSNLVTKWEAAARLPGDSTRQVVVRSGVVLGRGGGAISLMLLPFRLGLGGPIGSGHQFFPWIHIRDLVGILTHALEANHVQGVLNGVAPASTTTNAAFAQALGAALGRPAFLPLPSIAVQAVYGRERAIMLLEGQKVIPRRTLAAGYQYSFPELGAALKEVVA
ncbi:epimerase family protein SDR39U1 isoform X4 [Lemur catta]|uniref:epimerase family protein SDR39U1 isoform X4 n=1 Tax=Lemur catta TaxID=9447 RepID=UPI001E26C736|nr:epimerase family protein SDR39U1 isoform X4 [Lemur catta]XP_045425552.1 epimerase family protein SDR39U1 isoform X4 [Lemur catta]